MIPGVKEDIFIASFYKDIRRWKEKDPLTAFNPTKTGPFVLYTTTVLHS